MGALEEGSEGGVGVRDAKTGVHFLDLDGRGVDNAEESQVKAGDIEGFRVLGSGVGDEFTVGVDNRHLGDRVRQCSRVQACAVLEHVLLFKRMKL